MAARAYWQGQIRLALVSIPVEIYSAEKSGAAIKFRHHRALLLSGPEQPLFALRGGGGGGHGRRLHNFQVTEGDVNTGFDLSIPQPGDDARLASVGESLYYHSYCKSHCTALSFYFISLCCTVMCRALTGLSISSMISIP